MSTPVLRFEFLSPDDPSLPKPRVQSNPRRRQSSEEVLKLQETHHFGGLVPTRDSSPQFWRCTRCDTVYRDHNQARECCGAPTGQVQICLRCQQRIADCTCPNTYPA